MRVGPGKREGVPWEPPRGWGVGLLWRQGGCSGGHCQRSAGDRRGQRPWGTVPASGCTFMPLGVCCEPPGIPPVLEPALLSGDEMLSTWGRQSLSAYCNPGTGVIRLQTHQVPWKKEKQLLSEPCLHAKSLRSCPTLWDPVDCSPPGSSVRRIFQARILVWVAISSRGSS